MASKKPRMDLPGRRATNPPDEECVRRYQNIAAIVWRSTKESLERGIRLTATEGLASRHYASARARMGLTEADYGH